VATVVGAGVTVFEALKAYDTLQKAGIAIRVIDLYSIQPIDAGTLQRAAAATRGRIVTVEDHYAGGGIGDAVAMATTGLATVRVLAVREIPRSGTPDQLIDRCGLSARHIVETVHAIAE
jgi:transketolase